MILLYTVLFHLLMDYEGQEHTWLTGFYWTLTVMSTLGFGDITFHTDLGRGLSCSRRRGTGAGRVDRRGALPRRLVCDAVPEVVLVARRHRLPARW